jgi:hypothetical protein
MFEKQPIKPDLLKQRCQSLNVFLSFFLMVFGFSKIGLADVKVLIPSDVLARFEQLEAKINALQTEIVEKDQKYEAEMQELRRQIEIKGPLEDKTPYIPPAEKEGPKWLEGLAMGGDFRLRYEGIERNEATRDRNRFRYRLRWKITKQISKDVELGFRFVPGSNTDPTATNQTLTGDFTYKNIFIDQAYAKYRPTFLVENVPYLEKAEFAGGKFENPFAGASSSMVWDGDIMTEGFSESFEFSFLEKKLSPFITLGQFLLQENETLADSELYGFQGGLRWNPPGFSEAASVRVTNAVAYYEFSDYARNSNFIVSGTSLARGNTRFGTSTSLAAGDFDVIQAYNEVKFKAAGLPVKLFSDFAMNVSDQTFNPDGRNFAYEYGITLGSAKKKGDWDATWYYAYIEPNAVVGAFSESDFGMGHADKRGNLIKLGYKLTDSLKLGFAAHFVNNITGADDETRRFQSDIEWVF